MKFELLDTVVLARDLPEHGLRAGDLGAVVETYGADGLEVEFVQASGQTKALVTLKATDLRSVADRDILAVRAS
jgi:chitinase